jgi:hypothetical protein
MPNSRVRTTLPIFVLILLACALIPTKKRVHAQNDTETVIATYRLKQGKEDDLLKLLAKHWSTIHRLGMVRDQPHLVLRGKDDSGKTFFVEILTWDDSETPDHAPTEVRAIWKDMEPLVEPRDGHPGIDYPEVRVVTYPAVP